MIYSVMLYGEQLVDARPLDHKWSEREKQEFTFIQLDITKSEELAELLSGDYEYKNNTILHKLTGQEWDNTIIFDRSVISGFVVIKDEDYAVTLKGDWQTLGVSVCEFLCAPGFGEYDPETVPDIRRYWYIKIRAIKDYEGIRDFLKVVHYGTYSQIAMAGRMLPQASKDAMLALPTITKEDQDWLKWNWGIA